MMRKFQHGIAATGVSAIGARYQSVAGMGGGGMSVGGSAPTTSASAPITSNAVDSEPQVVESISSAEQAEMQAYELKQQQKMEKAERTRNVIKRLWDSPRTELYGSGLPSIQRTVAPWCGTPKGVLNALHKNSPKDAPSARTGFSVWVSVRQAERFQMGDVALDVAEYTVEAPSTLKQEVKDKKAELWEQTMLLRREFLHRKTNDEEKRELYGGLDESKMLVEQSKSLGKGLLKDVNDADPIVQSARNNEITLSNNIQVNKISEGIVKVNDTVYIHQSKLANPEMVDYFFANGFGPGDISYDAVTGKVLPLEVQRDINNARKDRLPKISRHIRGKWFPVKGMKTKMEAVGVVHARSLWISEADFDAAGMKFEADLDDSDKKREIVSGGVTYFHLSKVEEGAKVLYDLSTKTDPYPMMHSLRHTSLSVYSGQPKVPFWIDGSPVPPNQAKRMVAAAEAAGVDLTKNGNWWAREQPANIKAEEHVAAKRKLEAMPSKKPLWHTKSAEYSAAMWNKDLPSKEDLALHKTTEVKIPISFKNVEHTFSVYPIQFDAMQTEGNLRAAPEGVPKELAYMSSALLNAAQIEYKMPFRAMTAKVQGVMSEITKGKGTHPNGDVIALTSNGDFAYSPEKGVLVHWGRLVKDLREFQQHVAAHNATVPHGSANPNTLDIDLILDNIKFLNTATEGFTKKIASSNVAYNAWTGDMLPAADQEALRKWVAEGNKVPDHATNDQLAKFLPQGEKEDEKTNLSLWVHEFQVAQFAWMLREGAELGTSVNGYYHLNDLAKAGEILTDLSFKSQPWPLFKFLRVDCKTLPSYFQPKYVRNSIDDTPIIPTVARQIQAHMTQNRDTVIKNMKWVFVPVKKNQSPPEDAVAFLDGHMKNRYYIEDMHPNVKAGVYSWKHHARAMVNPIRDVKLDEQTRLRGFTHGAYHRVTAREYKEEEEEKTA